MIMLTKEQLADLLRETFEQGALIGGWAGHNWVGTRDFEGARERNVRSILGRSSGGHDDHGREVE